MPLKVIGAGLGRTGTLTLRAALTELGLAPCHHMHEVFANPAQGLFWARAARGEAVDWEEVFAPYLASVDWPSCHFYRQLAARYPEAQVILTLRDPERWYESMNETILRVMEMAMGEPAGSVPPERQFGRLIIAEQTFGGDFSKANVIAAFNRHVAAVRETIPAQRLLVYEVAEGWAPLCDFLKLAVPDSPFPRTNSREEFWQFLTAARST